MVFRENSQKDANRAKIGMKLSYQLKIICLFVRSSVQVFRSSFLCFLHVLFGFGKQNFDWLDLWFGQNGKTLLWSVTTLNSVDLMTFWEIYTLLLFWLIYRNKKRQRFPQDVFDGPQKRSHFWYLNFKKLKKLGLKLIILKILSCIYC